VPSPGRTAVRPCPARVGCAAASAQSRADAAASRGADVAERALRGRVAPRGRQRVDPRRLLSRRVGRGRGRFEPLLRTSYTLPRGAELDRDLADGRARCHAHALHAREHGRTLRQLDLRANARRQHLGRVLAAAASTQEAAREMRRHHGRVLDVISAELM
jgi:hypothetical protein